LPSDSDRIVVHPRVLASIAALTALSVPGVAHMDENRTERLWRLARGRRAPGVELRVDGNSVSFDLRLIASSGFSLLDVSRKVQASVVRAVSEMTDMEVREVNVQIAGVQPSTFI